MSKFFQQAKKYACHLLYVQILPFERITHAADTAAVATICAIEDIRIAEKQETTT